MSEPRRAPSTPPARTAEPPLASAEHSAATPWFLTGGGEAGALMRETNWAATPVGHPHNWPTALKTLVATLLHSRHPMFLWWGPELTQFYNDAYLPSFGVGKHPGAMGQAGRECWPEIWSIIGPQIEAVMTGGVATWHEDALVPIFRNGKIEDVYWTYGYSPAFDDDGRIAGTLVVCTETTARVAAGRAKQALDTQLRSEYERLQQLLMQVPAGVCILRGDALTFDFANEEYERLVGRKHVAGRTLHEVMPELAGQGFDDLLRKVMASGQPFVGHELLVKLDRTGTGVSDYYYSFVYRPFRGAMHVAVGVLALVIDVTEHVQGRRKSEELALRLKQSEQQFHLLAESIPQLAWAARADGHIDWYNRRWYEYTGSQPADMEGWGWKSVHDPGYVDSVTSHWQAALSSGEPFEMSFPLRRHDGVFRWHLTRAMPLRDASGLIVRWFGTNTDVDDSRRAELERSALLESEQAARQLAETASRAKDEFLATASHELRTPLNAILGWARLLRAGQLDAPTAARATETIERNALVQVRLIEDILDGSRIITGKLHLEIRPLDLTALVAAALDAVRPAAEAKKIVLSVSVDPLAARVIGDPERLQQVVWNLVSNAIKFTPKGGMVDVSLRRDGTDIELAVLDSGEGIRADFLPHVFERFRQAEGSTTRRYGGLGLGLALVRHLVEAHGGTVHAESEGEGRGSRFVAKLPVQAVFPANVAVSTPSLTQPGDSATRMSLAGVAVLVVDDEADARDLVATALETEGAHVTRAAGALQALELLRQFHFAALVSDIGMPEVDGYELIRRTRALDTVNGQIKAIALTAYAREEDRRLAVEAGFDTHISKPVEPQMLVRLIAKFVA